MTAFKKKQKGFTLVEMLVVIALIAILIAILMPAIGAARRAAKKARAMTEIRGIEAAFKGYLSEYGKWPHKNGNKADCCYGSQVLGIDAYLRNNSVMGALRGIDDSANNVWEGNPNHERNPRRIPFIEVQPSALTQKNTAQGDNEGIGNYIDPWGNQYQITCDTGFDGSAQDLKLDYDGLMVPNCTVAVWSMGPDGRKDEGGGWQDNIVSWGDPNPDNLEKSDWDD